MRLTQYEREILAEAKRIRESYDSREPGIAWNDGDDLREFVLLVVNDGEIYRRFAQPIIQNQVKHMRKGRWTREGCVKAFGYFADNAAQHLHRKEGLSGKWHEAFPKSFRRKAAED